MIRGQRGVERRDRSQCVGKNGRGLRLLRGGERQQTREPGHLVCNDRRRIRRGMGR